MGGAPRKTKPPPPPFGRVRADAYRRGTRLVAACRTHALRASLPMTITVGASLEDRAAPLRLSCDRGRGGGRRRDPSVFGRACVGAGEAPPARTKVGAVESAAAAASSIPLGRLADPRRIDLKIVDAMGSKPRGPIGQGQRTRAPRVVKLSPDRQLSRGLRRQRRLLLLRALVGQRWQRRLHHRCIGRLQNKVVPLRGRLARKGAGVVVLRSTRMSAVALGGWPNRASRGRRWRQRHRRGREVQRGELSVGRRQGRVSWAGRDGRVVLRPRGQSSGGEFGLVRRSRRCRRRRRHRRHRGRGRQRHRRAVTTTIAVMI